MKVDFVFDVAYILNNEALTEKSARKPPPLGVGRKRGLLYLTS